MNKRNRSQGWSHAKKTGHQNEEIAATNIANCPDIQNKITLVSNCHNLLFSNVKYGGLHESKVESIIENHKTTSKTDIMIPYDNKTLNISLKKDSGGQVFLISVDNFIFGFEKHYSTTIPNHIKRALALFFGSVDKDEITDIVNRQCSPYKNYEIRKNRLTASTLHQFDLNLYNALIEWFADNIRNTFDFCFIRGMSKNQYDWANIIWYKNFLNENTYDNMFNLNNLRDKLPNCAEYGSKNGGTTIQLPFGFLQWHNPSKKEHGDMQFHHSLEKLINL